MNVQEIEMLDKKVVDFLEKEDSMRNQIHQQKICIDFGKRKTLQKFEPHARVSYKVLQRPTYRKFA